jgi:hypothetical protein
LIGLRLNIEGLGEKVENGLDKLTEWVFDTERCDQICTVIVIGGWIFVICLLPSFLRLVIGWLIP